MQTLNLTQGSSEWLEVRSKHFTASEAPAMLGLSKYVTRAELLRQKATGVAEDVDSAKQRLFDAGHEAEALARQIAEEIMGCELFPVTVSMDVDGLPLLASLDGIDMEDSVVWENKLWNSAFAAQVSDSIVPDTHWPQLEQQLLITGASKALFTVSDGTKEKTVSTWYGSIPARRAQLIAGWKQFAADLAAYQHVEVAAEVIAAPINDLPALSIEITGNVVASNLAQWRGVVTERIAAINTDLQTDQQFADADKMVKFLADGEDRIKIVKAQAQAQAVSIDEVFRALDDISATMRTKRLELDKLVKARKENIRGEIAQEGMKAYAAHCAALNTRLKGQYLPGSITAAFAEVMKGKKTVSSLRDSVSTELARVKIESNALADKIDANLTRYGELAVGFEFLFRDLFSLVPQQAEAFEAMVSQRISQHTEAKRKAEEATRERIAKEEREKAEREAGDRQRERNAAALQEITGIQQQVMIAQAGRLGVRKGGTLECLKETLAETEAWPIDTERFGVLAGSAQQAKDKAIAEIRALIVEKEAPQKTDQATVSQNGASSPPTISMAEAVAESAPSAVQAAPGAASVTAPVSPVAGEIDRSLLISDLRLSLMGLSLSELQQVAHCIERLQSIRKAA